MAACLSLDRAAYAASELSAKRNLLTPRAECLGVEPLDATPALATYYSRAAPSPATAARRSLGRGVSFRETVEARAYAHGAPPAAFAEACDVEERPLLTRDGPRPGWAAEKYLLRQLGGDSDSDSDPDWDSFG